MPRSGFGFGFGFKKKVSGGGGSPAYDPLTAFGTALLVWLDAADASTLFQDAGVTPANATDLVGQWNDKSGNTNHVSATGITRPTRSGTGTGLVFSGSNKLNRTTITQGNQPQPYTIIVVGLATTNLSTFYDNGSSGTRNLVQRGAASTTVTSFSGLSFSATSQPDLATKRAILCEYNGTSSSIRVNNGTATTGSGGTNVLGALNIGGNASNLLNGEINEILMINRLLTSQERTDVQTYLSGKHGV